MAHPLDNAKWFKSSHSGPENDCVEVAHAQGIVGIRDSKDTDGGFLTMTPEGFAALISVVRAAEVDPRA
jgi:hypothetical protein